MHRPRRVVGIEVQGVEVEPLVLELGPLGDLPPHADEDVAHLLHEGAERMPGARQRAGRDGRDVDRLGSAPRGLLRLGQLGLARSERLPDLRARPPDEGTEGRLLIRRHVAQRRVERRER